MKLSRPKSLLQVGSAVLLGLSSDLDFILKSCLGAIENKEDELKKNIHTEVETFDNIWKQIRQMHPQFTKI